MESIYHDYWQQELMYQFLVEDKCKKKAYDAHRTVQKTMKECFRICVQREHICSMC